MPSVMEIAMKEMSRLIELANANLKILPGPIVNVGGFGAVGDGETDDSQSVQNAIDYAVANGMKAVFFPHGETGEYSVTGLTDDDQVVFFGDNASFVGGYVSTINQFGDSVSHADLDDLAGTGRTTETVKGNADDLTAHKAENAPHAEVREVENLGVKSATTLTIASGEITITQSFHYVDTEGLAVTDDLNTINGGAEGDILVLRQLTDSRDITIKHGLGNIYTFDASDLTFNRATSALLLIRTALTWLVVGIQGVKRSEIQKGTVTISLNASRADSNTVTFPVAFGSTPKVVAMCVNGSTWANISANAVTATGFTAWASHIDGTSVTTNVIVDWIAILP